MVVDLVVVRAVVRAVVRVVVRAVVITIMQHQRKLASILWPPSHAQRGSHQAVTVR